MNNLQSKDAEFDYTTKSMQALKEKYITKALIVAYERAFYQMTQGVNERPVLFLDRLVEAAELAEIKCGSTIQRRFKDGLHPDIKQHCIIMRKRKSEEWLEAAEAYWTAYHPQQIIIVDDPFYPRNHDPTVATNELPVGPVLNTMTNNALDMNDIQEFIRDIIKEELGNYSRNQDNSRQRSHFTWAQE